MIVPVHLDLMRHGDKRRDGVDDITPIGKVQVAQSFVRACMEPYGNGSFPLYDLVLVSDMHRTRATAEVVLQATQQFGPDASFGPPVILEVPELGYAWIDRLYPEQDAAYRLWLEGPAARPITDWLQMLPDGAIGYIRGVVLQALTSAIIDYLREHGTRKILRVLAVSHSPHGDVCLCPPSSRPIVNTLSEAGMYRQIFEADMSEGVIHFNGNGTHGLQEIQGIPVDQLRISA